MFISYNMPVRQWVFTNSIASIIRSNFSKETFQNSFAKPHIDWYVYQLNLRRHFSNANTNIKNAQDCQKNIQNIHQKKNIQNIQNIPNIQNVS